MQSADCIPFSLQTAYLAPCSVQTAQVLRLHAIYIMEFILHSKRLKHYSWFQIDDKYNRGNVARLTHASYVFNVKGTAIFVTIGVCLVFCLITEPTIDDTNPVL